MESTPVVDDDDDYNEGEDVKLTAKEYLDLIKFHNDPKGPLKYTFVDEDPLTGEDVISEGETEHVDEKKWPNGS